MDMFEESGWILTKNDKSKIKIAACGDETNVFDKTQDWMVIDADKTRKDTFKEFTPERNRIITVFIRDLLNCSQQQEGFVFESKFFSNVFICGTVVLLHCCDDKQSLIVDDGTSNIKCFMPRDKFQSMKKTEDSKIGELLKDNRDNTILQATAIMLQSKKQLEDSIPSFSDLQLGDIVKILGTLKEYNRNRYVFIKKIAKEPEESVFHCKYLEELLNKYNS